MQSQCTRIAPTLHRLGASRRLIELLVRHEQALGAIDEFALVRLFVCVHPCAGKRVRASGALQVSSAKPNVFEATRASTRSDAPAWGCQ